MKYTAENRILFCELVFDNTDEMTFDPFAYDMSATKLYVRYCNSADSVTSVYTVPLNGRDTNVLICTDASATHALGEEDAIKLLVESTVLPRS